MTNRTFTRQICWGTLVTIMLLGVACSDPPMDDTGVIPTLQDAMVDVLILPDGGMLVRPGDPNDPPRMRDPQQPPPTSVDTRLQYELTPAGEQNLVSCDVYDANQRLVPDVVPSISVSPENQIIRTNDGLTAEIAGVYTVTCVVPAFGLVDDTPERWTVRPGTAAQVTTELSQTTIEAGNQTEVSCAVADAYGNALNDSDAEIIVEPQPERFEIEGRQLTVASAGRYQVSCSVPGTPMTRSANLTVVPGQPAQLTVTRLPDQEVYGIGEIVELVIEVRDGFENPVENANTMVTSEPMLTQLGGRRFSLERPGRYDITVTVPGTGLRETVELLVDEGGPAITCLDPTFGEQLEGPVGADRALGGRVVDTAGVRSVLVSGQPVNLGADGRFQANVPAGWGINVHEVVAEDITGEQSTTLCGFFLSDRYQDADQQLSNAVQLRIGQEAIDDGDTARPYDSLGDLLRVALNSNELIAWLDATARNLNPVVPEECRVRVIGCIFSAGMLYRSIDIDGPNDARLRLINGGLRLDLTLRDIAVGAQLTGTLGNRGTLSTDRLSASADFALYLNQQGNFETELTRIYNVEVGEIESNFEGLVTGTALEALVWLMDVFFRDAIIEQVTLFIETEARAALDGLFSGIELSGFDAQIDVPSLAGGAGTPLIISNRLSQVDFTPNGALIGVAVGIGGEEAPGHRSIGAAIPPGQLPVPEGGADASATVDLTLVNLVLHQLWKAGYFERQAADLVSAFTGGFPGFNISIQLPVPPSIIGEGEDGTIRLLFGPIFGEAQAPPLGGDPLGFRAAAEVDVGIVLADDGSIRFDPVDISELSVSIDDASVDPAGRAALDGLLLDVIQGLLRDTLANSLPALPIPRLTVPEALVDFGVPAGLALGVTQARLSGTTRAWRVAGRFSEVDDLAPVNPGGGGNNGNMMNGGLCEDTCRFARDGDCDDGGPDSDYSVCELGSDCADCGPR